MRRAAISSRCKETCCASSSCQPVAMGVHRGHRAGVDFEFEEDIGNMADNGVPRDPKRLGDLSIAFAFRDQAQYLELARRQRGVDRWSNDVTFDRGFDR